MNGGGDGADRLFDNQLHAHSRREVKNGVALAHEDRNGLLILNRVADKLKVGLGAKMRDVLLPASGEIVQNGDAMALIQKQIRQVRPDETGPASDKITLRHCEKSIDCGRGGVQCEDKVNLKVVDGVEWRRIAAHVVKQMAASHAQEQLTSTAFLRLIWFHQGNRRSGGIGRRAGLRILYRKV